MKIAIVLSIACVVVGALFTFLLYGAGGRMRSSAVSATSGMRHVQRALEAYRIDHGAYPPSSPPIRKDLGDWGSILGLTTPVAYLSSLWPDPFFPSPPGEPNASRSRSNGFLYYSTGDKYLLVSAGIDGKLDIHDPASLVADQSGIPLAVRLAPVTYDRARGFGLWGMEGDVWVSGGTSGADSPTTGSLARPDSK